MSPRLLPADLNGESVMALAFLADQDSDMIRSDLTRDQQVRYLATGIGFLGSSRDYLETIARQFTVLGIDDPDVSALIADVRAFAPTPPLLPAHPEHLASPGELDGSSELKRPTD